MCHLTQIQLTVLQLQVCTSRDLNLHKTKQTIHVRYIRSDLYYARRTSCHVGLMYLLVQLYTNLNAHLLTLKVREHKCQQNEFVQYSFQKRQEQNSLYTTLIIPHSRISDYISYVMQYSLLLKKNDTIFFLVCFKKNDSYFFLAKL